MKFNVTISSPSPLIALGSLAFNGTRLWLDSTWVTDITAYTVYLDSTPNALTRQPTNDLLFYAPNLDPNVQHQFVVQPATLLDAAKIEMDLGDRADTRVSLDDGVLFQESGFSAKGKWNTAACLGAGRTAGTCHVSEGSGSEIRYTFEGDAITLYGAVESSSSLYTVSIDGAKPISYSPPTATSSRPITVLAHASNLGSGAHTLTLTSLPRDGKSRIEVDSAEVYTIAGRSTSPSGTSASAPATEEPRPTLSRTTVIGIVVGSLCAVALLTLLLFFYQSRKDDKRIAANKRASRASGIRVEFTRRREDDEETLASSKFSVKEGLELGVMESPRMQRPPAVAKGGMGWRA